jgi:hypothetical protein
MQIEAGFIGLPLYIQECRVVKFEGLDADTGEVDQLKPEMNLSDKRSYHIILLYTEDRYEIPAVVPTSSVSPSSTK